jgi:3'-phosphoadenosine 5'-phosphosulfate sulfotransferase (PAPS reductase)/FAD synthetase
MKKVRHVLGISGGKDSAALAIYMKDNYPNLDIEYYTADTGKELEETYDLISSLENYLGKNIIRLQAFGDSPEPSFDHKLKMLGGFLPSVQFRWCTKSLKLDVFEKFVGDDPVVSYVGIRGDENREGYISKKTNIQSIFPFRRNIWSEDLMAKVLAPSNIEMMCGFAEKQLSGTKAKRFSDIFRMPLNSTFGKTQKLNLLLGLGVKEFNSFVFSFIKNSQYPLSYADEFPLVNDESNLNLQDIFIILNSSGVGVPKYYNEIEFEVNGKKGVYSRSRSGCYFCFFQKKIEWVWLYEQHPEKFALAMEYEKEGYKWNEDEPLEDLIRPERIIQIKEQYIEREARAKKPDSPYLLDILSEADTEGCASCFI